MAQFVPKKTTLNEPTIVSLVQEVFNGLNNRTLYADEQSTIFGKKTILVIEDTSSSGLTEINQLLQSFYGRLKQEENVIDVKKILTSNNGERSFDIQCLCNIKFITGDIGATIYINLSQGGNKVKRKENKANKAKMKANIAMQELQKLQTGVDSIIADTEKLSIAQTNVEEKVKLAQDAEYRAEEAKTDMISNYWIPKFQIMLF